MKKGILIAMLSICLTRFGLGQHKEEMLGLAGGDPVHVQVFPNPAIEYVSVRFDAPIARKTKLILHNIIGNMMEFESEEVDDFEMRIKVKDLPTGYYFLSIREENAHTKGIFKFLKR